MSDKYYVLSATWQQYIFKDDTRLLQEIQLVLSDIEYFHPEAVLIMSGSEINIDVIYGKFFELSEPWFVKNKKRIYIFSSAPQFNTTIDRYPHVLWYQFSGYDTVNFRVLSDYYLDNKPITTDPTKLFTCYNNRPADYRTYIIDQLAKYDLLDSGIVTYRHLLEVLPTEEEGYDPLIEFTYYKGKPRLVDEEDFILHQGYVPNDLPRSYLNGLVDLVTETTVNPGEFFLSEKTNKPLMAQKPFLVLAPAGFHMWLKETYNIEQYTEIFDYSFDSCIDFKDRANGIVNNLVQLHKLYSSPEDYKQVLKILKPKLEHNLNSYMTIVASGDNLLKNMPFEWMTSEPEQIRTYLSREDDYNGEFYTVHSFIYAIVNSYRNGTYKIPDISR
jgi:hypothetical protein